MAINTPRACCGLLILILLDLTLAGPGPPPFVADINITNITARGHCIHPVAHQFGMPFSLIYQANCSAGEYCPFPPPSVPYISPCATCINGMYCPADTEAQRDDGSCQLLCPAGSYCASPSNITECPAGFVCPEGSVVAIPCAVEGAHCPAGSSVVEECLAGFYCPTPAQSIICPEGHFCPNASSFPRECGSLSSCPEGSAAVSVAFLSFAVIFGVVGGIAVLAWLAWWQQKRANKDFDAAMAQRSDVDAILVKVLALFGGEQVRASLFHGFGKKSNGFDIGFEDVGFVLGDTGGPRILSGVTGRFERYTINAIMGPSGSGKTTLLNVLTGKAFYGHSTGKLYLNDQITDVASIRQSMSFVPQNDVMYDDLTVRENLDFNAKLRANRTYTTEQREAIVNDAISILGLAGVQHTVVGGGEHRGVSGGQKKRVNIGMELVSNPSILFLDEPTTGLDATIAMDVCSTLKELARVGMTVVMVIHQPRLSLFNLFHNVLLLGDGGRVVYQGPPRGAPKYFENLGFPLPALANPADHMMDVIAGAVDRKDDKKFSPAQLPDEWEAHKDQIEAAGDELDDEKAAMPVERTDSVLKRAKIRTHFMDNWERWSPDNQEFLSRGAMANVLRSLAIDAADDQIDEIMAFLTPVDKRPVGGKDLIQSVFKSDILEKLVSSDDFLTRFATGSSLNNKKADQTDPLDGGDRAMMPRAHVQFVHFMHRETVRLRRSLPSLAVDGLLTLFLGVVMGLLFGADWDITDVGHVMLKSTWMSSVVGMVTGIRVFGSQEVIAYREASAGVSQTAFFLANNVVALFEVFVRPLLFGGAYYALVTPLMSFADYYWVLLGVSWVSHGYAYIVTVSLPLAVATVGGVIFACIQGFIFTGVQPTLTALKSNFATEACLYIAAGRWSTEPLVVKEVEAYGTGAEALLTVSGYEAGSYERDVFALFILGFALRVVALVLFVTLHGNKKM